MSNLRIVHRINLLKKTQKYNFKFAQKTLRNNINKQIKNTNKNKTSRKFTIELKIWSYLFKTAFPTQK